MRKKYLLGMGNGNRFQSIFRRRSKLLQARASFDFSAEKSAVRRSIPIYIILFERETGIAFNQFFAVAQNCFKPAPPLIFLLKNLQSGVRFPS